MLIRISTATLGMLGLLEFAPLSLPVKTKVYLVGDSAMANKVPATFSETGWGMPLTTFFDSTVVVTTGRRTGAARARF